MTDDIELRDKDHVVLKHVEEGHNDTQKITAETTLENHHVRYSLKKLENQGLLNIEKPEGMTERTINGQKRVFQHPLKAEPTQKGLEHLERADQEDLEAYQNLTHKELVRKVHQLETEIDRIERSFQILKKQIQKELG